MYYESNFFEVQDYPENEKRVLVKKSHFLSANPLLRLLTNENAVVRISAAGNKLANAR